MVTPVLAQDREPLSKPRAKSWPSLPGRGKEATMTTKEIYPRSQIMCREYKIERRGQEKIVRNRIPHGPVALLVILFDFLLRLDPR